MSAVELLAVLAAGLGAGLVNAIAGSGSLLTFPVLLALGVPPVTANTSNGVGLAPGGFAAAWGMRELLAGQGRRVAGLAVFSAIGSACGAVLLLTLPSSVFGVVVPVLIAVGVVLVAAQPWIARWANARRDPQRPDGGAGLRTGVVGTGAYGGYFGAAQGILLVALLGTTLPDELHVLNAIKNVLAGVANGVSAVIFIAASPFLDDGSVDPLIAATIAIGAIVGALTGAKVAGRIPASALRAVLVLVGVAAIVNELR